MSVTLDPTLDDAAGARPRPNRPRPALDSDPLRLLNLRANLLPDEIVAARRVDVVRRRVLLGLVVLIALLVLGYAGSWWQTHSAENDLSSAQSEATSLQNQVNAFGPLVTAQARTSSIRSQLQQVMTGDLPWKSMLATLSARAPVGTTLTAVTGSVSATSAPGAASAQTAGQLPTGVASTGTLSLTGSAADERSVANYADLLGTVKGLASPYVTSVTQNGNRVSFTMTVTITAAALGGRFAQAARATSNGTTQNGH